MDLGNDLNQVLNRLDVVRLDDSVTSEAEMSFAQTEESTDNNTLMTFNANIRPRIHYNHDAYFTPIQNEIEPQPMRTTSPTDVVFVPASYRGYEIQHNHDAYSEPTLYGMEPQPARTMSHTSTTFLADISPLYSDPRIQQNNGAFSTPTQNGLEPQPPNTMSHTEGIVTSASYLAYGIQHNNHCACFSLMDDGLPICIDWNGTTACENHVSH